MISQNGKVFTTGSYDTVTVEATDYWLGCNVINIEILCDSYGAGKGCYTLSFNEARELRDFLNAVVPD